MFLMYLFPCVFLILCVAALYVLEAAQRISNRIAAWNRGRPIRRRPVRR